MSAVFGILYLISESDNECKNLHFSVFVVMDLMLLKKHDQLSMKF